MSATFRVPTWALLAGALLLAAIGVFGVVSYSVTQRLRELGPQTVLPEREADWSCCVLQHVVEFLLCRPSPALPFGNLDTTALAVHLFRNQRISAFFGRQLPMRTTNAFERNFVTIEQPVSCFQITPFLNLVGKTCRGIVAHGFSDLHQSSYPPLVSEFTTTKIQLSPLRY